MIDTPLTRLLAEKQLLNWSRQLIDDLSVRLRALTQSSVSSDDTTYKYLSDKLVGSASVTLTVLNPGGDEQIQFTASGGGGGGVTQIDDGIGTLPSPDPLTTTGKIDIDINPLTLQTAIHHADDMFIFLDASVSSTPSGVRKGNVHGIEGAMTFTHLGNPAHVLATNIGIGAEHAVSGLTTGQVLYATGATSARFQALTPADIPGVVDGAGTNPRVAFWADSNTLTDDAQFLYNVSDDSLQIGDSTTPAGTSTGIIIGADGRTVPISGASAFARLITHNSSGSIISWIAQTYSNTTTFGSSFFGTRSRGTKGAQTGVIDNDHIWQFAGLGHDGAGNYRPCVRIIAEIDDASPSATSMGGALIFETVSAGSLTLTERMRIAADGDVTLSGSIDVRNVPYTWPAADAAGVLTSNGLGTLSWAAGGGGGSLTVQEDAVNVVTGVTTLNFVEPATAGANTVSSPGAAIADVNLGNYLYRSGRALGGNNITMATDTTVPRITGGVGGGQVFELQGSSSASTAGFISVMDKLRVCSNLPATALGTLNMIEVLFNGFTQAPGDTFTLRALNWSSTISINNDPLSFLLFRAAPVISVTADVDLNVWTTLASRPQFVSSAAGNDISFSTGVQAVDSDVRFSNTASTASTCPYNYGINMLGQYGASWTIDDWAIGRLRKPTNVTGVLSRMGLLEMDDQEGEPVVTYSLWVKDPLAAMCHEGPALFCADQSTLTQPDPGVGIELRSTTQAVLVSRMLQAERDLIATPTDGMVVYNNDTDKFNFLENSTWNAFQPSDADLTAIAGLSSTAGMLSRTGAGAFAARTLQAGSTAITISNPTGAAGDPSFDLDTDLKEIAALANARGNILITNSTANWVLHGPGTANHCLRSDGTDVAFGSGILDNNAKVAVNKNSGATVGTRRRINFIEGSNVTLTIADDSGNEEVDVTIAASASGGGPTFATDVVTGSTTVIANGSDTTLNTVTTTPGSGVDVCFIASITWDVTGSTEKEVVLKLFKDGAEVNSADRYTLYHLAAVAAKTEENMTAHWVIASEASGSHTYTLRATETVGSANDARRLVSRLTVAY